MPCTTVTRLGMHIGPGAAGGGGTGALRASPHVPRTTARLPAPSLHSHTWMVRPGPGWPGPQCCHGLYGQGRGLHAARASVSPGSACGRGPHTASAACQSRALRCGLQQPAHAARRGCRVAVASRYSAVHAAWWLLTTMGLSVPPHRYASTRTLTYNRLQIHVCTHTHICTCICTCTPYTSRQN